MKKISAALCEQCSNMDTRICFQIQKQYVYTFVNMWAPFLIEIPQWGAADAEIKVPSGENTELKRSPFKAWSKSV